MNKAFVITKEYRDYDFVINEVVGIAYSEDLAKKQCSMLKEQQKLDLEFSEEFKKFNYEHYQKNQPIFSRDNVDENKKTLDKFIKEEYIPRWKKFQEHHGRSTEYQDIYQTLLLRRVYNCDFEYTEVPIFT